MNADAHIHAQTCKTNKFTKIPNVYAIIVYFPKLNKFTLCKNALERACS